MYLPYLAMGYRLSKQKSLSNFCPYFLFFGRESLFRSAIQTQANAIIDTLHNPDARWAHI